MAIKFSYQYWYDDKGAIQFGDSSWVNCPDDDPDRQQGTEGQFYRGIEREPEAQKDQQ